MGCLVGKWVSGRGGGEAKENELKRIILAEKEKSKREKKGHFKTKKKRDTIDKRKGVICWDNGEKYWMI